MRERLCSVRQTEHELELARVAASRRAAVNRRRDPSEARAGEIGDGRTKLSSIEEVECRGQELQCRSLREMHVLCEAEVSLPQTRSANQISPGVAECSI